MTQVVTQNSRAEEVRITQATDREFSNLRNSPKFKKVSPIAHFCCGFTARASPLSGAKCAIGGDYHAPNEGHVRSGPWLLWRGGERMQVLKLGD